MPLRSFEPESLVTTTGRSVIQRLIENSDYVIIDDADLQPIDVADHMSRFSLHSVPVQDVTKALGLTENYVYLLWPKGRAKKPSLGGEELW